MHKDWGALSPYLASYPFCVKRSDIFVFWLDAYVSITEMDLNLLQPPCIYFPKLIPIIITESF